MSVRFEISSDTTLAELSGMMRLLPEYHLRVAVYPGHVRPQRYEVSLIENADIEGLRMIKCRGPSIWAALALAMELAVARHIAASTPPDGEE